MEREKITTTPERLKELMNERGLKQIDILSKAAYYCNKYNIKLTKSDLSQYISGKVSTPTQDKLFVLANALNVSEAWLMGFDVPMERKTPAPSDLSELYEKYPNIKPIKKVKIPMLGNIACGEPTFADEQYETFIETDGHIQADFCLTCDGDSMEPKLMNGDIVFIRKQPEVNDGQIAAVLIEDEATLKRVYYDKPNNVLTLVAENPKYRPFIYSGEQLDHIRILGRAVSLYRKLK